MTTTKTTTASQTFVAGLIFTAAIAVSTTAISQTAQDPRTPIYVTAAERIALLAEMRGFLETVQAISEAATENDMETVAEYATASGMKLARTTPAALMKKFPPNFNEMGAATHIGFDELAISASVSEDPLEIVAELSDLMLVCTACHGTYRFEIEGSAND